MEKKGLRKLQLTRETLRNLSTDELSRVVGGTGDTDGCPFTVLPCNLDPSTTVSGGPTNTSENGQCPSGVGCGSSGCPTYGC